MDFYLHTNDKTSLYCFQAFCGDEKNKKMFLTRTENDRVVNTFSPKGRLFRVEYAIKAIKLGSTAIGLKIKESVVLAVEKHITSPLLVSLYLCLCTNGIIEDMLIPLEATGSCRQMCRDESSRQLVRAIKNHKLFVEMHEPILCKLCSCLKVDSG
ncbi:proteasome subunit alpha type-5 [Tanacetum coccineum]